MTKYPIRPERRTLLSIEDLAQRSELPIALSIKNIGALMLEGKQERFSFYKDIVEACQAGILKCHGDVFDDWQVRQDLLTYTEKPDEYLDYSAKEALDKKMLDAYWVLAEKDEYEVLDPPNYLIHRDDMKVFFQGKNYWPIENCLLSNWWTEPEQQADKRITEVVVNAGTGSQTKTIGDNRVRAGRYKDRDVDAIAWLAAEQKENRNFDLDALTIPQIKRKLETRNFELWGKGFDGWNRKQRVWPKKQRGKKGMQRRLKP